MTHAQHCRLAAVYRREARTRAVPLRTFDDAGNLTVRFPARTYTITPEGRLT